MDGNALRTRQVNRSAGTLFVDYGSWVQELHPLTKLCYLPAIGAAVYAGPPGWLTDALLFGVNWLLLVSAGVHRTALKSFLGIILPLLLFMLPVHGFLNPGNATEVLNIYGYPFYLEGVVFACNTLLQLSVVLAASLLFVMTTPPADLIRAISYDCKSPCLAYVLGSPLLLIPAMRARAASIQSAQRARGLNTQGNMFHRIRSLAPLVVPLAVGAIMEMEQRSIALEVRGFRSSRSKTSLRVVADSARQRFARKFMVAASLCLLLFRLWW